jgi:hypothetical protein
VKGVCECKVVLDRTVILHRTADVKSGMIGSSFDTEKTSMLRALDLIPVAGCVSDQNDVVVDRNAISGRWISPAFLSPPQTQASFGQVPLTLIC